MEYIQPEFRLRMVMVLLSTAPYRSRLRVEHCYLSHFCFIFFCRSRIVAVRLLPQNNVPDYLNSYV